MTTNDPQTTPSGSGQLTVPAIEKVPEQLYERVSQYLRPLQAINHPHCALTDEGLHELVSVAVQLMCSAGAQAETDNDSVQGELLVAGNPLHGFEADAQPSMAELQAECDALRDQVQRLEAMPEEILVLALGERLASSNAKNYIETSFQCSNDEYPDLGTITVILQRNSGKTPHILRLEAEAERDALKGMLAELRQWAGDVVSNVLYPLSHESTSMGQTCDGLGQFTPDQFARIDAALSEKEPANSETKPVRLGIVRPQEVRDES